MIIYTKVSNLAHHYNNLLIISQIKDPQGQDPRTVGLPLARDFL